VKSSRGSKFPSSRRRSRVSSRTRKHVRLVDEIQKQLERASPQTPKEAVGELAVDIGDLASVGRAHRGHIAELLRMSFPKDRPAFCKLLAQFEVNLLFENQWHLSSLKRLLPRLVKDAYRSSEESNVEPVKVRRRGGAKPSHKRSRLRSRTM
jgi:hypothetical protein